MKKKFLSFVLALCLMIPCAFALSACGDKGTEKTMNVSINPEVSFVVDENNKIINVVYENEDAGTLYANVDFSKMTAEDAVKVLVERSVITGHFTFTGETVTLDINGTDEEDIEELKDAVSDQIESVCSSLGVNVTINAEILDEAGRKAALVVSAQALAPEKTKAELEAMSAENLVKLIKDKQEEYKGLAYDQLESVRDAFSAAENAILQSINTYRNQIASLEDGAFKDQILAQIDTLIENYNTAKATAIAQAKAQFETAKAQLVTAYKNQVTSAKAGLEAHLDAKLEAGAITQAQHDYWMSLTNVA